MVNNDTQLCETRCYSQNNMKIMQKRNNVSIKNLIVSFL